MIKYTQKQLKEMVKEGIAEEINYITMEGVKELKEKEGWLNQIGWAQGIYGCNGMLLQGHNTSKLYAITSRTTAIYLF